MQTMFNNHTSIQALRDNGYGEADFQVAKATVMYQADSKFNFNGTKTFDAKDVYYRKDNGEPIAIHGKRYKPVQYPDMISRTRDMLERSNLDCDSIKENIQVSPNGGMCLAEYTLPATSFKTPDNDYGSVKVMALSSFNGVWSFILSLGLQQWACLNSQIMITNPASIYKARHTNKLDIDAGVRMLGNTANVLETELELWQEMYNTRVDRHDVAKAFANTANYTGDLNVLLQDIVDYGKPVNIKNNCLAFLYDVYNNRYRPNMGVNQWAVYNAITDWATHAPSKSKNVIALGQRRTERATTAVKEWLQVA